MARVTVVHPNIQHSLHLAVALQQGDLLDNYITRLYTSWNHFPFALLSWLPQKFRENIELTYFQKFQHFHREIDLDKVRVLDTLPLMALIMLKRWGLINEHLWAELHHRTSIHFQRKVASLVLPSSDVLVSYDTYSYEIFKKLKKEKIKLVLDLSSAHPATIRQIIDKEKELWPEYSESLNLASVSDQWVHSVERETELADYILVGSRFILDSCIKNGIEPQKIFVLPYGTDINRFYPRKVIKKSDKFVILFVGRIGQLKGVRYLLDALATLNLPNLELWLCGRMLDKEPLSKFRDNFKHLNYIPYIQMPEIYNQADIFVLPTLLEGLSQASLEAMACGKPVITTPNSGMEGIIRDGENGFIVPIRDSATLAQKISYLYEHGQERGEMGRNARRTAEIFSWHNYRINSIRIFNQILNNSSL